MSINKLVTVSESISNNGNKKVDRDDSSQRTQAYNQHDNNVTRSNDDFNPHSDIAESLAQKNLEYSIGNLPYDIYIMDAQSGKRDGTSVKQLNNKVAQVHSSPKAKAGNEDESWNTVSTDDVSSDSKSAENLILGELNKSIAELLDDINVFDTLLSTSKSRKENLDESKEESFNDYYGSNGPALGNKARQSRHNASTDGYIENSQGAEDLVLGDLNESVAELLDDVNIMDALSSTSRSRRKDLESTEYEDRFNDDCNSSISTKCTEGRTSQYRKPSSGISLVMDGEAMLTIPFLCTPSFEGFIAFLDDLKDGCHLRDTLSDEMKSHALL